MPQRDSTNPADPGSDSGREPEEGGHGGTQRLLDAIELIGNKVPHPAVIFLALCVLVIVLSAILLMEAITKTFAGLAGLIFLLLIIAQFIAYFNYSNIATVAAINLADALERADIGAVWLLIGLVAVTTVINIIIPGIIPKWAILAPVFVPLFLHLGVAPQTVLAAYRVGDSPTQRHHAPDGLPAVHRAAGPAVPEERGRGHGGVADDPLRPDRRGGLDDLLRALVPARHPARPRIPGQALSRRARPGIVRACDTPAY